MSPLVRQYGRHSAVLVPLLQLRGPHLVFSIPKGPNPLATRRFVLVTILAILVGFYQGSCGVTRGATRKDDKLRSYGRNAGSVLRVTRTRRSQFLRVVESCVVVPLSSGLAEEGA